MCERRPLYIFRRWPDFAKLLLTHMGGIPSIVAYMTKETGVKLRIGKWK